MRNLGLDIARSTAIISVLVAHGISNFFGAYIHNAIGWVYFAGTLGVEIFFALSGFLIGKIILTDLVDSPRGLGRFYARRWLRTLPLYYLMVWVVSYSTPLIHWQNLVFLQNFNAAALGFIPVSWSLSIEEWFYLLMPVVALLWFIPAKSLNGKRVALLSLCTAVAVFSLWMRIHNLNPSWDFGVRKQIPLRMDSIMFGVLAAGVKLYWPNIYRKLHPVLLFPVSVAGMSWLAYYVSFGLRESFFARTYLFTLMAVSCALFVVALERIRFPFEGAPFKFISSISYGTYLIHWMIFDAVTKYNKPGDIYYSLILYAAAVGISLFLAWLSFTFYESPILWVRDRVTTPTVQRAVAK